MGLIPRVSISPQVSEARAQEFVSIIMHKREQYQLHNQERLEERFSTSDWKLHEEIISPFHVWNNYLEIPRVLCMVTYCIILCTVLYYVLQYQTTTTSARSAAVLSTLDKY